MIGVAIPLLKQVDTCQTIKNVKGFFKYDFQMYLNRAGKHRTDLNSPQLDPTGVASHGKNTQENKLISNLAFEEKVWLIGKTIKNCTNTMKQPYSSILHYTYIKELPTWQVAKKVGYGDTRFSELKRGALLEFAERLEYWGGKYNIDFPDLVVYEADN